MGPCLMAIGMVLVSASQDTKPGTEPGSAGASKSAAYSLEKGLAEIERLRVDALRTLNHYATEGANNSADRLEKEAITGDLHNQEHRYYEWYEKVDKRLREMQVPLRKIVPTEPISKDIRGFFGDASLPEFAVAERRRLWIEQRMKGYDDAWSDGDSTIKAFADAFTPGPRAKKPLVDTESGRAWQHAKGYKPGIRETEAAEAKRKLRIELERRLTVYFDDAREAWLQSESGK